MAHGYLHASVPAIPLWIDEGLAEYFEVPRGHGGLNRPHLLLLSDMMEVNGWQPNLEELEALSSAGEMQQDDYAEAWAWVYFLLNSTPERRELLTEYLTELRDKGRAAPLSNGSPPGTSSRSERLPNILVDAQEPSNRPTNRPASENSGWHVPESSTKGVVVRDRLRPRPFAEAPGVLTRQFTRLCETPRPGRRCRSPASLYMASAGALPCIVCASTIMMPRFWSRLNASPNRNVAIPCGAAAVVTWRSNMPAVAAPQPSRAVRRPRTTRWRAID